jgi:uncharacterized protein (UPF0332 family)
MNEEQKGLAKYRLDKAKQTLAEAQTLYKDEKWNGVLNRVYYSIFHAIRSLLALKGKDSSKHSGVITMFHKEFVKTRLLNKEVAKYAGKYFEKRASADYEDFKEFDKEDAKIGIDEAQMFLIEIEEALNKILSA